MAIGPSNIAKPINDDLVLEIESYIDERLSKSHEVKHALEIDPKYQCKCLAGNRQVNYRFNIFGQQPNDDEVMELANRYKSAGWYDLRFYRDDYQGEDRGPVGAIVLTRKSDR